MNIFSKHFWFLAGFALLAQPLVAGPEVGNPSPSALPGSKSSVHPLIGVALPSKTAVLGAVQTGRVARVAVVEGQTVTAGDLVCQLDDGVQRARTEIAQTDAESDLAVRLAKAIADRAERDVQRLIGLHGNDFVSSKELSDSQAEAEIRRLEYDLALLAHEQSKRALQRERELLDQYSLRSPFAAYVASIQKQVGEAVEIGQPTVTLVQLDPLDVTVDCPLHWAPYIRQGDQAVLRPVDEVWPTRSATVVVANRVADAASQTFRVKLAVPNGDGAWVSGIKVAVEFERHPVARRDDAPRTNPEQNEPTP